MDLHKLITGTASLVVLICFIGAILFYIYPINIIYFTANPNEIKLGESSSLSWKVSNANSIEIDQGLGRVSNEASEKISPCETTVYTMYAKNFFGDCQEQVRVIVIPSQPIITCFYADLESIEKGDESTLHWNVSGADSIFIDRGLGFVDSEGSKKVFPKVTTTYTLNAKNKAGSISRPVRIEVVAPVVPEQEPKIKYFYADSETVDSNSSTRLRWSVSDARKVYIDHGIGDVHSSGSKKVYPKATTTYTLTAENSAGSVYRQVKIEMGN
jgi:hypothetical protein